MFDKLFTPINEPFFAIVCNAGNIRPHPVGDMRHFSIHVGDEADVKFTQISSKNFLPLSFSEQAQSLSVL